MADRHQAIRWWVLAVSLAITLVIAGVTGAFLSTRALPAAMIAAHGLLFVAGLVAWLAAMQVPSSAWTGWILFAAAIAVRALLLPLPPSDDLSRYLWEGRLVLAGQSPYAQPAALAADQWRDAIWAGINHRDQLTAYPPLAELLFAAGAAIDYTAWPLKLIFTTAELATLVLLWQELQRRHLPIANLALAAFSPVLLLATAGEAHFDAVFVLAMLLALRASQRRRLAWAWVWLGVAIQLKIVAVLLAPLLLRRGGWRWSWLCLLLLVFPALPFATDLPNLAQGLFSFGTATYHNGFLPTLLRWLVGDPAPAAALSFALLALWSVGVAWRVADPFRAGFFIIGGLLLLSPIVHVWYLSWIVPFLVLMPQPAWLLLSGLQALYYTAWLRVAAGTGWVQPVWVWWAEWLPFILLLVASGGARLIWSRPRSGADTWPPPRHVSVVMPAYNEGEGIAIAVNALARLHPPLQEIIVVDGGSTDQTRVRAAAAGARVVGSRRGRGYQIAAGIAEVRSDVIWIVHADIIAAPQTIGAIIGALGANPTVAGGAAGLRYGRTTPLLLTMEALNATRSALFGLSFGDQGQFVRRAALPSLGGYPDQPLMEDVELSLRLRRAGPVLHLGANAIVSTRRWDHDTAWHRIGLVVRLTASYLLSGNRNSLAHVLYRTYYPMNEK